VNSNHSIINFILQKLYQIKRRIIIKRLIENIKLAQRINTIKEKKYSLF